jgi:hypothetical protein
MSVHHFEMVKPLSNELKRTNEENSYDVNQGKTKKGEK